jgi:hypothetical protein
MHTCARVPKTCTTFYCNDYFCYYSTYSIGPRGLRLFLFATASRLALWPTHPLIQWVPRVLSLEIKQPERESDHYTRKPSNIDTIKSGRILSNLEAPLKSEFRFTHFWTLRTCSSQLINNHIDRHVSKPEINIHVENKYGIWQTQEQVRFYPIDIFIGLWLCKRLPVHVWNSGLDLLSRPSSHAIGYSRTSKVR